MPTFEAAARFLAEYGRLTPSQQAAFHAARRLFVDGLREGRFHPRLRVKGYKSIPGAYEMTWAPNGRALWRYEDPVPGRPGPHVIWLRIGGHEIFERQ